jgi:hypothetical protein
LRRIYLESHYQDALEAKGYMAHSTSATSHHQS